MTNTLKTARTLRPTKTATDVQAMLFDIATVLRLTAVVKAEMLREQAEVECRPYADRRTDRVCEPMTVLA